MSEDTTRANPKPASVDRLSMLWHRINDHKMVQWSVAYVALAYGIQHGIELTSDAFEWPHAVVRVSMLMLVLGLPLVMTLAWYHGERASRRISGPELTIISILLVGISLLFYVFVQPSTEIAARAAPAAQQASVAAARSASSSQAGAISIAVLPFINLSSDKEQEFFSDGMTEEITSALAKVPNLRVVGRTSAFQFKGENKDLRAIGQTLSATHLIEGSVRKDGNEVRITAQLIKADDGTHLWTESYNRELKGVFAIQEEIAQAIVVSLRVPLGLKEGESLVSNRTGDTESYQNYLRAKALVRSRNIGISMNAPIALLEQVVARDPNYAPAWALLSQTYSVAPNYDPIYQKGSIEELSRVVGAALPKAEAAARRATELDPRSADAYAGLGSAQLSRGKILDAEESLKQALNLDPLNPDALHWYSQFLGATARLKEAVAVREQLRSVEPLAPVFNSVTDRILWVAGENDKAMALAEALPGDYGQRALDIARIYAAMGRYKEAADAALTAPREFFAPGVVETAARLLRTAPAPAPRQGTPYLGPFSFVFAYVGVPERAFEFNEHNIDAGYQVAVSVALVWQSDYRAARKTERFKSLMRKSGFVEYWRAKGWPEFCHPVGADDFVCD